MSEELKCPKCGGEMWDNREGKRNPKAPDYKCKTKTCDGVIWPPRNDTPADTPDDPACPVCAKKMWDNRVGKRNPKAPDFKCRDKECEGVIWPPKDGEEKKPAAKKSAKAKPAEAKGWDEFVPPTPGDDDEDVPF